MARIVYVYALPESLRKDVEGCPGRVGLRALTSREEIDASKVGGYDLTKSQYEAVMRAICELDGKTVTLGTGEVEKFWESCGPKIRALLLQAYNRLSTASEAESTDFFKSEQVKAA